MNEKLETPMLASRAVARGLPLCGLAVRGHLAL